MNDKQPSILKIIWIDYWAFVCTIFAIIAPGLYLYGRFSQGAFIPNLDWITLGLLTLALFGLASRYISIVSLYNSGLEAKATISDIGFFRDRGYIKYIYTFENRKYASQMTVMKNRITTQYRIGNEIEVMVDRENPKKSIIRDLFV